MSNIAKHAYRSRLASTSTTREGPRGYHKNPGDFSGIAHINGAGSRTEYLRRHWNFLPARAIATAHRLSTALTTPMTQTELNFG